MTAFAFASLEMRNDPACLLLPIVSANNQIRPPMTHESVGMVLVEVNLETESPAIVAEEKGNQRSKNDGKETLCLF